MSLIVQPIILCGGNGTRLWPMSNKNIPKQFITISNKGTLLDLTLDRIKSIQNESPLTWHDPLLIMNHKHKDQFSHPNVIYELYPNDTAVAIARASLFLKNKLNDHDYHHTILIVFPSDHFITNLPPFIYDINHGISQVNSNNIVLFGIEPTSPESKYGYIIPSSSSPLDLNNNFDYFNISFIEKPSSDTALELIKNKAMWNSGIFSTKLDTLFSSFLHCSFDIFDWVTNPRPGKAPSFDVAILQSFSNLLAHYCLQWNWNDIGTWQSFLSLSDTKSELNSGSVNLNKSSNVHVLNRSNGNIIVIGCSDLLVVYDNNDVLIVHSDSDFNNDLKNIVSTL